VAVTLALDHFVIAATDLAEGVAYVEDVLGLALAAGGKHALMGTHNTLLKLGSSYLEVIAIDPEAKAPNRPRWYDLDNFSGLPRLVTWVAQTADLEAALALAPAACGRAVAVTRDDLTWDLGVAEDGKMPFAGAFPSLIAWGQTPHPTARLPDAGCGLTGWHVSHPKADQLNEALDLFDHPFPAVGPGPVALEVEIETPNGPRILR
jgi:catechol 2,3-dioxygenase-like lactoylglutathione lyase family enzyme